MCFTPFDLIVVHLLGLFVGLYVFPRLMPGWGKESATSPIEKDIDQAIAIANDRSNVK